MTMNKKPLFERYIEWLMYTDECEVHPIIIEKAEIMYAQEQKAITEQNKRDAKDTPLVHTQVNE